MTLIEAKEFAPRMPAWEEGPCLAQGLAFLSYTQKWIWVYSIDDLVTLSSLGTWVEIKPDRVSWSEMEMVHKP